MARLRKFSAYRMLERPYTRKSKYKKKSYVRATPTSKVIRYNMGDSKKSFQYRLSLVSKSDLQIRHNAIESARQSSNRLLEKALGKSQYYLVFRLYPHHILRENPLASGAGADRMSTGMQKSFGKPIGIAARVKAGQTIITLDLNNLKVGRMALRRVVCKIPCSCSVQQEKLE